MKRLPEVTEENARQISEAYQKVYGPILGTTLSEHDLRTLIGPAPHITSTLDVVTRVLITLNTKTQDEELMLVPEATQENAELLARERWLIDKRDILKYVVAKEWEELNPDSQVARTESALQYLQALRSMLEPRPCGAAFGHPYPGAACKLKAGHKEGEHTCGELRWKNLVVSRPKSTEEPEPKCTEPMCTCATLPGRTCRAKTHIASRILATRAEAVHDLYRTLRTIAEYITESSMRRDTATALMRHPLFTATFQS